MSGLLLVRGSVLIKRVQLRRGLVLDLGLHGLMLAVMTQAMIIAPSSASALLGAVILIAASVPCAPIARRSAAGWRHIADLWAMAGLLVLAAASASPATSQAPSALPSLIGASGMGQMAHGAGFVLASPSGAALAVVACWLVGRLVPVARAGRRGERMAGLDLGSAVVTAASLGLMLAFH